MRKKSDLRAYQDRGVSELYGHAARLAVLPMGSGKTVMGGTALRELLDDGVIRHAFILAPKRVAQLVWPPEFGAWEHLQDTTVSVVAGEKALREAALATPSEVHVVGHDNIPWLCKELEKLPDDHPFFDAMLIDEISRMKGATSTWVKDLVKLRKRFKNLWGMTGTPRPNGYLDMFKPLQIVTGSKLWGKSYYAWRRRVAFPTDFNQYNWEIHRHEIPQIEADIDSVSFTVDESEMPELPEINSSVTYFDLPGHVRKFYKDMERKAFANINERNILAANMAVATGKLCQMTHGFVYGEGNEEVEWLHALKSDWLVDVVDSMNGAPLLIGYEFVEDLRIFKELLGKDLPHFGDDVSDADAVKWERMWNRKELPLLALHPASAGHGLNLQFGGHHMAWFGFPWSAELYDQTVKRFHRSGQTERCFLHHCLARGTVDELKYDRVHNKMEAQAAFIKHMRKI